MPELPEVEALAGFLREHTRGKTVTEATEVAFSVLKTYDPPLSSIVGRDITEVSRHGKFLDVDLDGWHLVFHFARGGWLRWRAELPTAPARPGKGPLALRVGLDDDSGFDVTEAGTTKRLAVWLVGDVTSIEPLASLGPDPLRDDFDVAALATLLRGRRTRLKGLLRDQRVIAGIGNAYSDEILHVARMSPYKLAASLTDEEIATLHSAMMETLADATQRSAGLPAAELKAHKRATMRVHGRTGQPCPVCGDTIAEVSFSDSALQYCPSCQTGGKPLADRRLSRLLK